MGTRAANSRRFKSPNRMVLAVLGCRCRFLDRSEEHLAQHGEQVPRPQDDAGRSHDRQGGPLPERVHWKSKMPMRTSTSPHEAVEERQTDARQADEDHETSQQAQPGSHAAVIIHLRVW